MDKQKSLCDDVVSELLSSKRSPVITEEKYCAIVHHLRDPKQKEDPHFKHWIKSKGFQLIDLPALQLQDVLVVPKDVSKQDGESRHLRVIHTGQLFDVVKQVHVKEMQHAGYKKCMDYIQRHYYGVTRSYIQTLCRSCPTCQLSQSQKTKPPLRPIETASSSVTHHLDLLANVNCDDESVNMEPLVEVKVEVEDPLCTPSTSYEVLPPERSCFESLTLKQENDDMDFSNHEDINVPYNTEEVYVKCEAETEGTVSTSFIPPEEGTEHTHSPVSLSQEAQTLQRCSPPPRRKRKIESQTGCIVEEKDIYDLFGIHVAKTLRDFNNEETFNIVKKKINDILSEAQVSLHKNSTQNQTQTQNVPPATQILLPVNASPQFMLLPNNSQSSLSTNNSQTSVVTNNPQMILLPSYSQGPETNQVILPNNSITTTLPTSKGPNVIYLAVNPGQVAQNTSTLDQITQNTAYPGQVAQNTYNFEQAMQVTSNFGQAAQNTSNLGQISQNISNLHQAAQNTSSLGQISQPCQAVQRTSIFEQNTQNISNLGHVTQKSYKPVPKSKMKSSK